MAENCKKIKEFGPQVGRVPGAPLDPPMLTVQTGNYLLLLSGENIAMVTKMLGRIRGWDGSLHPKFDFLKRKLASLIFLTMVFEVVVTSPKYFPSLFHMIEMTTTVKLAKAVMTRQDL